MLVLKYCDYCRVVASWCMQVRSVPADFGCVPFICSFFYQSSEVSHNIFLRGSALLMFGVFQWKLSDEKATLCLIEADIKDSGPTLITRRLFCFPLASINSDGSSESTTTDSVNAPSHQRFLWMLFFFVVVVNCFKYFGLNKAVNSMPELSPSFLKTFINC